MQKITAPCAQLSPEHEGQ